MSRHAERDGAAFKTYAAGALVLLSTSGSASAQRVEPSSSPSLADTPVPARSRIDLTLDQDPEDDTADCSTDDLAGAIANEIVVCRRRGEASDGVWDKEQWERRYAADSAYRRDPAAPDFIRDCREQGMPFGCMAMGPAPTRALIIDVGALPAAPPDSDADRIARGLPPLNRD